MYGFCSKTPQDNQILLKDRVCFTWADHNTLLFGQLGAEVNIVVDAIEI